MMQGPAPRGRALSSHIAKIDRPDKLGAWLKSSIAVLEHLVNAPIVRRQQRRQTFPKPQGAMTSISRPAAMQSLCLICSRPSRRLLSPIDLYLSQLFALFD